MFLRDFTDCYKVENGKLKFNLLPGNIYKREPMSAIAFGKAEILTDKAEKIHGLTQHEVVVFLLEKCQTCYLFVVARKLSNYQMN